VGSIVSVISALIFILTLWESLVSQRSVIFRFHSSAFLEFSHSFPPMTHRYASLPQIFLK
jgi:hypothetical protein